jgi:membrane-associated phospholipid phosphatase
MKKLMLCLILFAVTIQSNMAQQTPVSDSSTIKREYLIDSIPHIYKTKLFPSMIIPGILIAYGLTTIKNNGLYSSYRAKNDIQSGLGKRRAPIDDYLIFSPYIEFGALLLLRVKCKNDLLNTALLIVKSEILMLAIVEPLKSITKVDRPDGSDNQSFPSGHTAEAFVAATIVYREYRYKSSWYGIGAFTLATTVGVYRMINNKHWESDVIVAAGVGMLSTNLVYATHLHRWGRKEVCFLPTYNGISKGLMFSCRF